MSKKTEVIAALNSAIGSQSLSTRAWGSDITISSATAGDGANLRGDGTPGRFLQFDARL